MLLIQRRNADPFDIIADILSLIAIVLIVLAVIVQGVIAIGDDPHGDTRQPPAPVVVNNGVVFNPPPVATPAGSDIPAPLFPPEAIR